MNNSNFKDSLISKNNDVLINIEVSPNSNKFSIESYNEWRSRIIVRIKNPPNKGKANKEIIKEFSKIFKCDVEISKGLKSKEKTLILKNKLIEDALNILQKRLNI